MLREEQGRAVIHCDRCPIRIDIGAHAIVRNHELRMPTAWLRHGPDEHLCPTCASKEMRALASKPPV